MSGALKTDDIPLPSPLDDLRECLGCSNPPWNNTDCGDVNELEDEDVKGKEDAEEEEEEGEEEEEVNDVREGEIRV